MMSKCICKMELQLLDKQHVENKVSEYDRIRIQTWLRHLYASSLGEVPQRPWAEVFWSTRKGGITHPHGCYEVYEMMRVRHVAHTDLRCGFPPPPYTALLQPTLPTGWLTRHCKIVQRGPTYPSPISFQRCNLTKSHINFNTSNNSSWSYPTKLLLPISVNSNPALTVTQTNSLGTILDY